MSNDLNNKCSKFLTHENIERLCMIIFVIIIVGLIIFDKYSGNNILGYVILFALVLVIFFFKDSFKARFETLKFNAIFAILIIFPAITLEVFGVGISAWMEKAFFIALGYVFGFIQNDDSKKVKSSDGN